MKIAEILPPRQDPRSLVFLPCLDCRAPVRLLDVGEHDPVLCAACAAALRGRGA